MTKDEIRNSRLGFKDNADLGMPPGARTTNGGLLLTTAFMTHGPIHNLVTVIPEDGSDSSDRWIVQLYRSLLADDGYFQPAILADHDIVATIEELRHFVKKWVEHPDQL